MAVALEFSPNWDSMYLNGKDVLINLYSFVVKKTAAAGKHLHAAALGEFWTKKKIQSPYLSSQIGSISQ